MASKHRSGWMAGLLMPLAAAFLCISVPAQAQMSQGFKFLEAVRKKDGVAVEEALGKPGSTIVNARDITSGETALHIVAARRDLTWLRYLVSKGANVNIRDEEGRTPLQIATSLGWLEGVSFLIDSKASINETNDTGETPLITAVHRKDIPLMRELLKAGADPDRADNSGRSARDYARLYGENSQLVATIDTHTVAGARGEQATYGPTF